MSDEESKKESRQPIFLSFKSEEVFIHYRSIKKWSKGEYYNGIRNVYSIVISHFDMEDTIIEYHDEKIRDVEYSNFLDKLKEFDFILM